MSYMQTRGKQPQHPGAILRDAYLRTGSMTQIELARRIEVSFPRINSIVNQRRGITPDTALRLEEVFDEPARFWLEAQLEWDLWKAKAARKSRKRGRGQG